MKKIRTLIADDEVLAREGIATMLQGDDEVEVVGKVGDGQAALAAIRAMRPDLVYLDVQMPLWNGFDTLRQLAPAEPPAVIFVTAYDQYAVQAFEAGAVDYLLKPFRDARFHEALQRAKDQVRRVALDHASGMVRDTRTLETTGTAHPAAATGRRERVAFKVGGDYLLIAVDDLISVEAKGEYVQVCAGTKFYRVREALQEVVERLDPARFARIHRSYLVNLDHIVRISPTLYGDYTVILSNGTKVRLSRSYRTTLRQLLPVHFA